MENVYYKIITISLGLVFILNTNVFASEKNLHIEDELLQNNDLLKQEKIINKQNNEIRDELLNFDLYKDTPFRLSVYKNKYTDQPIMDELLDDDKFIENSKKVSLSKKNIPDEFFIEENIDLQNIRRVKPKNKYDFTKKQIPIKIKIAEQLKSTKHILEGSTIPFVADNDFVISGKKYSRGTTILGRVETISASDKMGTPESIKISNFYIPEEKEIDLYGSISKTGANRSIWVYPLYQAGNITFYVAGFIFVPIHGGRVKLLSSETFTVYYESNN